MRLPIRLGTLVLALWAIGTASSLANTVFVQVRTNCKPMEEFHRVEVTLRGKSYRASMPASPTRNWSRGVRVAEIPTGEGTFFLNVALIHRTRGTVVERPVRVTVGSDVQVVTVVLPCPEPEPRTAHGSAPAGPAPSPRVRRPSAPIGSSRPPPGARPDSARLKAKVCQNSVQGRVAWDYGGNRRWSQVNIDKLCKNAEDSTEPARCFQQIMHGNVSHGTNTRWRWQDALELCAGARDHRRRVSCFQRQIARGSGQRAAISRCRNA